MAREFIITLPSNSNLTDYPENESGNFRVNLAEEIKLRGDWTVGLLEYHFPKTFPNVHGGDVKLRNYGSEEVFTIPTGYYSDIRQLIQLINSKIRNGDKTKSKGIQLTYNEHTRKITIEISGNSSICFNDEIASILGFKCKSKSSDKGNTFLTDIFTKTVESDTVFDLPSSPLYIYTDLIKDSFVGHSCAPLLRVVDSKGNFGERICRVFEKPHYLPIKHNTLRQITVQIRYNSGNIVPFAKGHCILVLHFRQKFRLPLTGV